MFLASLLKFFVEVLVLAIIGRTAWKYWLRHIRSEFIHKMKWFMIEIKIPQETNKSPLAMEIVLDTLYQTGGTSTWFDEYWKGQVRSWFSLEIVSIEGSIHFFIRGHQKFKHLIEAQIYAHYPTVEIFEVKPEEDYTNFVRYENGGDWNLSGTEYTLAKEDYLPIMTYVDYGLDKDPKEEYKIDPLSSVVENLAGMREGEQLWYQILVRAADPKVSSWKKDGEKAIEEMMKKRAVGEGGRFSEMALTKVEKEVIAAMQRNISKLGFECGFRALYLGKKDKFNSNHSQTLRSLMLPFNSNIFNSFRGSPTAFDYPWEDLYKIRANRKKERMFNAYVLRSQFYPFYEGKLPFDLDTLNPFVEVERPTCVLNSEELATMFHFPGSVVSAPTMKRLPSAKSEPPPNLPV